MNLTVLGYVAFVVVLLLSVLLHEAGHFVTARRFGMKATEFFVGFGPRVWSFRRGETEYGVKAIPAGGYVKITGMTELDEVAPEDQPRAFYRQPAPQRAVVLAAGSVVHFLIAIALFGFIPVALGNPHASLRVGDVAPCVPDRLTEPCTSSSPDSPAKAAGLHAGDRVVAIDGQRVGSWAEFTRAIKRAGPGETRLQVTREGQRLTLTPELTTQRRPVGGGTGGDTAGKTEVVPVLGVAPALVMVRTGPLQGAEEAWTDFASAVTGSFQGLAAIPGAIPDLLDATFGDGQRSVDGLVGPVGIAQVSGEVLASGELPLAQFLGIMAALNVFIGIFNLLPLLPLDGGHLAVLVFEQARKGVYRLLGRADPGRVDLMKLLPAAYVFLALIIGLSVLLLAADIVNPIQFDG
ncbi:MAG: M50 family metallopeptidase [Carbonactinosporaceae bacterium]